MEKIQLLGAGAGPEWREEIWERKLQRGAKSLKIDLARLPARKSAAEKVRLAALLKTATRVTNGWLATRLAMGQPASVSQFVRRFRLARGDVAADWQAALSRVKT